MDDSAGIKGLPGRVSLTATSSTVPPLVVHQDTRRNAMEHNLSDNRYILTTNDDDYIVGEISGKPILKRLRASNDCERTRWMGMPLKSLIKAKFSASSSTDVSLLDSGIECIAIAENDSLVGMAIQEDLFLSWQRLEPILSGNAVDDQTKAESSPAVVSIFIH